MGTAILVKFLLQLNNSCAIIHDSVPFPTVLWHFLRSYAIFHGPLLLSLVLCQSPRPCAFFYAVEYHSLRSCAIFYGLVPIFMVLKHFPRSCAIFHSRVPFPTALCHSPGPCTVPHGPVPFSTHFTSLLFFLYHSYHWFFFRFAPG